MARGVRPGVFFLTKWKLARIFIIDFPYITFIKIQFRWCNKFAVLYNLFHVEVEHGFLEVLFCLVFRSYSILARYSTKFCCLSKYLSSLSITKHLRQKLVCNIINTNKGTLYRHISIEYERGSLSTYILTIYVNKMNHI